MLLFEQRDRFVATIAIAKEKGDCKLKEINYK